MADKSVLKTYVRPDNTAVLTCPNCGFQKTIDTSSFNEHKSKVKVKCKCATVFTTIIEFRKRIRKRTRLPGTYINHSQKDKKGTLTVTDVSVSGLGFTSMDVGSFQVEDELTIEFTLDDEQRSKVRKEVIVRGIRPGAVGCEFPGAGEYAFEGPLGFYVRS